MIAELYNKGFSGIYIDRDGYEYKEVEEIESQLTEKLGISPIVGNDGTLSFYKLR